MGDLSRIDWNLIPMLHALLEERHVSRAARRLALSQPAMSHALARLRRHFDDDLLVRRGGTYVLTPLGEQLAPLTADVVRATSSLATSTPTFDEAESTRTFTIAASEYVQAVLAPALLGEIRARAPGIRLNLVSPFTEPFRTSQDVLEGTDGWLAPREMLPGERSTGLVADQWACVVADDHPTITDTLTLEDVELYPWVAPTIRGRALHLHLDSLAAHGVELSVEVATESFTAVPFLVAGSDRIGVLQRSLALRLAPVAGVRVLECPWAVQPLHLTMWWHQQREDDVGHQWLRGVVDDLMTSLGSL